MKLVYINELGLDYKGEKTYEFIFNDSVKNVYGNDWDLSPASGRPTPPELQFIKVVGVLCDTELSLELVQNSDYFSVLDAVDEVIALGWESYDKGDVVEGTRIVFKYGEPMESITKKLTERGLSLKTKKL
jgi:hypothetical protein